MAEADRTSSINGRRKVEATKGLTIQSVDRALDILELLAASREALPLSEIGVRTGLNTSTCHHLLNTLRERGYVTQEGRSRAYALGNSVFALSDGRTRQLDLVADVMPILKAMNERTAEAVHLAVLAPNGLATLAKLETLQAVKVDAGFVGKSDAAHATATGKAMLAFLERATLDRVLGAQGLKRFTERTICDRVALERDFEEIRRTGIAEDREEFQPGVWCLGAPIRDRFGVVIASVSCSVPTFRAAPEIMDAIREEVRQAADAISVYLGGKPVQETRLQGEKP